MERLADEKIRVQEDVSLVGFFVYSREGIERQRSRQRDRMTVREIDREREREGLRDCQGSYDWTSSLKTYGD